jgi:hypothetical protein
VNGCPQPGSGGIHSRRYYDEDRVCSWCGERRIGEDEHGVYAAFAAMLARDEKRMHEYLRINLWA